MGKGIREVNWLAVAVIFAFILSAVNTFMIKKRAPRRLEICVVDIWELSSRKALNLSNGRKVAGIEDALRNADVKKEIDSYMQGVRHRISSPGNYGCDFIAVKGSIFGNVRDVTEEVMRDVQ